MFQVVSITLLCSWVLALTMTPLLCVLFLKVAPAASEAKFSSRFYVGYRSALLMALRRPLVSVGLVVAIFIVALQGMAFIPSIFFPPSDKAIFTAEFELPIGTAIERTEAVVEEIDRFIARELTADRSGAAGPGGVLAAQSDLGGSGRSEGVTNWATFIGQGGPRFYLSHNPEPNSPNYALAIINATSRAVITEELIPKLDVFCRERFPDLDTTLMPLQLGPPVEAQVQVRVSGREPDPLFAIVDEVKARLRSIPGTTSVTDDWGPRSKKLLVNIDQPRARRAGVTSQDVAISLQTVFTGFETTQFLEADEIIPVQLRSRAADRQDLGKLETLNVYAQATGRSVPLLQVADVEVAWEAARILRRDRSKTVTVSAWLAPGLTASAVNNELLPWLDDEQEAWPFGYGYEPGGEIESSVKANQAIGAKAPIGALIILLLLVGQFNSIRRTAIVLLTIPLGLVGVIAGLLIAQSYFGFMTLLGVIALAGIVINNAIVLLDRIKVEIDENGLEPPRAIVEAAQRRFRPILLTTATTMAGLLPLWFGGGPMWEPMAIAIIFGLMFATLLTLGVVPVLYTLFFRVSFREFQY